MNLDTSPPCFVGFCLICVHQAQALALRVEHLVWDMEAMSSGLSMGQLDTLKAVLLDQVARVDEAKVGATRTYHITRKKQKSQVFLRDQQPRAKVSISGGHSGWARSVLAVSEGLADPSNHTVFATCDRQGHA